MQALHVEQGHIGNSEARVGERPNKVLGVLAAPDPLPSAARPTDFPKRVAGPDNPFQFRIGGRNLLAIRLDPSGAFRSALTGLFDQPFAVNAEPEERAYCAQPLCLCPDTQSEVAVEHIQVAGGQLVEHNVAPRFGKRQQLLREHPVLAQRGRGDLFAFTQRDEHGTGISDGHASLTRTAETVSTTGGGSSTLSSHLPGAAMSRLRATGIARCSFV